MLQVIWYGAFFFLYDRQLFCVKKQSKMDNFWVSETAQYTIISPLNFMVML